MGIEDDQLLAIQNYFHERSKTRDEPTAKDAPAKVRPADKMLMLPPLFNGEKPEKAKTHYERFNQYIKFQTKEGNIKDTTQEAIEHISTYIR